MHIAYRGAAPAVQDLMGGQVAVGVIDTAAAQQYVSSGKLRAIGVASRSRIRSLPEVPTLSEQGLQDFEAFAWQGVVVPTGTPPETVAKFSQSLEAALASTTVTARLAALGVEPMPGTPEQMATFVRSERERWGKLIRDNNIRVE